MGDSSGGYFLQKLHVYMFLIIHYNGNHVRILYFHVEEWWNSYTLPQKKKLLAFSFANFEITRLSTGKANVSWTTLSKKETSQLFGNQVEQARSFFFWGVYTLIIKNYNNLHLLYPLRRHQRDAWRNISLNHLQARINFQSALFSECLALIFWSPYTAAWNSVISDS